MRFLASALVGCLLLAGNAVAREHHTDGRAYLQRANKLAGDGKCAAAVKDYTKAYERLHDPVVLFNRAECYRRMGENAKAVTDYRGYLEGFPKAPNRADIENKIAALEKPAAPPAGAKPPAPPPPPVAKAPPPPPPPPPPAQTAPPPPMPLLPPPPPSAGTDPDIIVESPKEKEPPKQEESSGSYWWLWTTLAVVAVGGGVAGYLLLRPKDEPLPMTSLGHYRF